MRETEDRITRLIQRENEKLTRPTAAFITFENDLGKMLAAPADDTVRQAKNDRRKILDIRCDFQPAPEPSDIIWENRHWGPWDTLFREFIAYTVVAFLLALSFAFIFRVSEMSSQIAKTFPAVNCDAVRNNYGTEL